MTEAEKSDKLRRLAEQRHAWEDMKVTSTSAKRELELNLPQKGANVDQAIAIVNVAVEHSLEQCPCMQQRCGT